MRNPWLFWMLLFSVSMNMAVAGTAIYLRYFLGPRPLVIRFAEKRINFEDRRLDLTEKQRMQFRELERDFLRRIEKGFSGFHAQRMEMVEALAAERLDEKRVARSASAVRGAQSQLHEEWVRYILSLRKALAPDQQEAFSQILRDRLEFPLKAPAGKAPDALAPKEGAKE